MYSSSLLQLSSVVNATGLAAQFKSIVPSDLFLALGLGFEGQGISARSRIGAGNEPDCRISIVFCFPG